MKIELEKIDCSTSSTYETINKRLECLILSEVTFVRASGIFLDLVFNEVVIRFISTEPHRFKRINIGMLKTIKFKREEKVIETNLGVIEMPEFWMVRCVHPTRNTGGFDVQTTDIH